ncbi:hypothetical protein QA641_31125 [Bradyrhizobium sp. CB1650]|uniref:hypothetical protein n=1 Tax=Bradyrhizobium sp. CB1650 TaxID=3039153 RepID=UPI0024360C45|nr:hypothetical protein [Bradyrhizobium sp. CB1650]WGD50057.1 hypothetical protein QA641_31125 [Bradyrhizobium sp. CB1650]
MGEIVAFASKSECEPIRLIREARAMYDGIFPPGDAVDGRSVSGPERPIHRTGCSLLHRKKLPANEGHA